MPKKKLPLKDLIVGNLIWVEGIADFGEGYIACPGIIESINIDTTKVKMLGKPNTIGGERGQHLEVGLDYMFVPDPQKVKEHAQEELEWIKSQRVFLENYETTIKEIA